MSMTMSQRAALNESMMTAEEERRVIADWQDSKDNKALDRLIRSHARLAYAMAARYTRNPDHINDLASAGMQGIIRAADCFDRNAGTRFATYAKWWIRTYVSNEISRVSIVVDIPSRTYLDSKMGKLEGEKGDKAHMAVFGGIDLHAPIGGEDGDLSPMDWLECPRPTPESNVSRQRRDDSYDNAVRDALKILSKRESRIIMRRRLKDPPDTLESIADDYKITRERVRQIEVKAMGKLKRALINKGFAISSLYDF